MNLAALTLGVQTLPQDSAFVSHPVELLEGFQAEEKQHHILSLRRLIRPPCEYSEEMRDEREGDPLRGQGDCPAVVVMEDVEEVRDGVRERVKLQMTPGVLACVTGSPRGDANGAAGSMRERQAGG